MVFCKKWWILISEHLDVYSNSKWSTDRGWLEICNPMNDFLSTFTDSEYQGCIGMVNRNDQIVGW